MADDTYRIGFGNLAQLEQAFERAPAVIAEEMNLFFARVLPHLQAEVVDRTPTAEGHLRNSVITRSEVGPTSILGLVGTAIGYAPAVEKGARPHPVSEAGILALAEWAKRKLPLGQAVSTKTGRPLKVKGLDELAMSAAHAIAWKIRHHGTPGAGMFAKAFAANRGRVLGEYENSWRRILARIGEIK